MIYGGLLYFSQVKKQLPIGIFDSGIGGLTVASAMRKELPNESIIYYGDTLHLPYGEKPSNSVREYATGISNFLVDYPCKAVVIACNTASAVAFNAVQEANPGVPIFNVIDPVVNAIDPAEKAVIGVIGTRTTIRSAVYEQKIRAQYPDIEVHSMATPLLAHMIEEGFFKNKISETVLHKYLDDPLLNAVDQLILGCTHYPLIEEEIRAFYGDRVRVLNSAELVAKSLKASLLELDLANNQNHVLDHFLVSDYTKSFEQSARFFFGEAIHLEARNIW